MIKYRCITKNMELINVNEIVLRELRIGDVLEQTNGKCYEVVKRQFQQIDEDLVTCDLIVKKIDNFKIKYEKINK